MEAVMDTNAEHVNEALISYAYAWMRKAHDDKIPGTRVLWTMYLSVTDLECDLLERYDDNQHH